MIYTCDDAEARVQHLENIYASLRHKGVPNTDRIMSAKGKKVYLVPRGIPVPPKTQADLRNCVVCVLEALVVGVVTYFARLWCLKLIERHFTISQSFTVIYDGPTLFKMLKILEIGF